MTHFSQNSLDKLSECHDDLVTLFIEVDKKHNSTIVCGHRGKGAQEIALLKGNSTVHWPNSKHNSWPSIAADVMPYTVEIQAIEWDDIKAVCVFAGRVLEIADRLLDQGRMTHRVRWGGDWDSDGRTTDQKFADLGHYELIPV